MPWHDWQFWIVTLLAVVALWRVLRTVIPRRRFRQPDGSIAAGPITRKRVTLTIERKAPGRVSGAQAPPLVDKPDDE